MNQVQFVITGSFAALEPRVYPGYLFINLLLSLLGLAQWWLSILSVELLLHWLSFLQTFELYFSWYQITFIALISSLFGTLLLMSCWVFRDIRLLGIILILSLWQKSVWPENDKYKMIVLDVGHGLAIVVQTLNHVIVYDTAGAQGKKHSVAEHTLVPFLKSHGINQIDRLIVSHDDSDHSGGMSSLLKYFKVIEVLSSDLAIAQQHCGGTQPWQYDGVEFEFLNNRLFTGNNGSCVLKIGKSPRCILLTGDIYKQAEKYLLTKHKKALRCDVLVAPYHGSKSSSSLSFIKAVKAKYVIFSSGKHQGFKLPSKKVINACTVNKAKIYTTSHDGAVMVVLNKQNELEVTTYR